MCEEFRADNLITVLRELDTAKAVMRQMQAQLKGALPTHPQNGDSEIYQATCHRLNKASERYRRAVAAFDAACLSHALAEPARPHAQPANP
jgi:hypothetical protein